MVLKCYKTGLSYGIQSVQSPKCAQ